MMLALKMGDLPFFHRKTEYLKLHPTRDRTPLLLDENFVVEHGNLQRAFLETILYQKKMQFELLILSLPYDK